MTGECGRGTGGGCCPYLGKTQVEEVARQRVALGLRAAEERPTWENCFPFTFFEHLLVLEDELIDAYLRRTLSAGQCTQFEKHFLASARRRRRFDAQQAITAGFFRGKVRPRGVFLTELWNLISGQPFVLRAALALFAVAAVAGAGVLGVAYLRLRSEGESTRLQLMAMANRPAAASHVAAFTLQAGATRGEARSGGERLQIAPGTEWVVLHLRQESAEPYLSFVACLTTASGEELLRQNRLPLTGGTVDLRLPADFLVAGDDYVVSLSGLATGGRWVDLPSFAFHVEK